MFLTERLVSLGLYALALLIACFMLNGIKRSQQNWIINAYLLILCVFAFAYKPYITADLYRLRQYILYWTGKTWSELIPYALRQTSPAWVIYSWLTYRIGDINWIQTIACAWTFGNLLYIVKHSIEHEEILGSNRGRLLFYIMAVGAIYLQAISGIRTMLGLSIVAFCLYREVIEEKKLIYHVPLYIVAGLMHISALPLVLARIVFLIPQQKTTFRKAVFVIVSLFIGASALYFGRSYIISGFLTAISYLTNKHEYTYGWQIIIGIAELIRSSLLLWKIRKSQRFAESGGLRALWGFELLWVVVSTAALPISYTIFSRYAMFTSMLGIPLFAVLMNEHEPMADKRFTNKITWLSIFIFALSVVRGDLCGYKFFEL